MKTKLIPKNSNLPPCAKKDEHGNLVTNLSRLQPNQIPDDLAVLKYLKNYLLNLRLKIAQNEVSEDWSMAELEVALKSLKNNKARDIWGHTYELFKYGDRDLKLSLLNLFNQVRKKQTFPSIFTSSTITSIWKKKGSQTELDNDRGIFYVTKIRSILDQLIYNKIYSIVDNTMSSSSIGAQKKSQYS